MHDPVVSTKPSRRGRWRPRGPFAAVTIAASLAVLLTLPGAVPAVARYAPVQAPGALADTEAPTAPGELGLSALTCRSVTLSWTASTDNIGVTAYDIYHDGQLMMSVGGSERTAALTLVPGAVWGLYVNARDTAGNVSQASPTLTVTVPQCQTDTQAPTAPAGLVVVTSGTSVTLTWRASTDNVGVAGYDVHRGPAKVGSIAGAVTRFVDSGLAPRTRYVYNVVARDAQDNVSARSNTVAVSTGASCATPVCGVTQVGADRDVPWGLVTLPDGSILYARRDAHDIARLVPSTGATSSLGAVPNVRSTDGEGGLMGLAISPTFNADRWLYVMHSSSSDNRVVRIQVGTDHTLKTATAQVLLSGILRNKFHNGGRLRWGPDNKLYVATGDGQNTTTPQNTRNLSGKILRINPDGTVPPDNPFGNAVWSYGHRNPQGLAFDAQGRLWEQEFGNGVMDETNLITRGGNYGWPACEGTSGSCGTAGFIAPKATYPTSAASCSGITIVRNVLYVACARGARLYRAPINGSSLGASQQHLVGTYGRLRTVEPAPDGGLWLTTTTAGDKDSTPNNSNEKILHVQLGR